MAVRANLAESVQSVAEKNEHLLLNLAKVLHFFFRVLEVYVGILLFALVYLLFSSQGTIEVLIQFSEWEIIFAAYCAVYYAFSILFREASAGRCFSLRSIRALRLASGAFLALFACAVVYSVVAACMAIDGFRGWGVSYPLGGFPPSQVWTSIAHGNEAIYPSGTATIDPSNLLFSLILWGLSLVFQYGACLQEEKDLVI